MYGRQTATRSDLWLTQLFARIKIIDRNLISVKLKKKKQNNMQTTDTTASTPSVWKADLTDGLSAVSASDYDSEQLYWSTVAE